MGNSGGSGGGMAHFLRLIFFSLFLFISAFSHADYPAAGFFSYSYLSGGFTSAAGAQCAAAVVARNSATGLSPATYHSFTYDSVAETGMCSGTLSSCTSGCAVNAIASFIRGYWCPSGGTLNNKTCVVSSCPAGESLGAGGFCEKDCSVKKGQSLSSGLYDMGLSPTANFPMITCSGGCAVEFSGYAPARVDRQVPPHYYAKGTQSFSGWSCSPGETTTPGTSVPPDPPIPVCAPGTCPGTVNGQSVCVPCADAGLSQTTTSSKTNSSTNSAGQTTTTTTSTQTTTSPDGSSVTSNSSTSTGTQSAGATGAGTKTTDSKKQDTQSFCAENPNSPLCKDKEKSKSFGGGDCSSPPVSEGDAISSAILFQAWKTRCALSYDPDAVSNLGAAVIAGNDPQNGLLPHVAGAETRDVAEVFVAASQSTLSASCPQFLTFSVAGHAVLIELAKFCDALAIAGNIIFALSLLTAVRIVGGGK